MTDKKLIGEWVRKCRAVLIEMETKNITQRALSWTQIVNTETSKINNMLGLQHNLSAMNLLYHYDVPEPLKYLTFLSEWNGIKTRGSSSMPSCYTDFESKAKNWLNGRRAPNYGNTLFPDMIKSSDKYAKKLASLLFGVVANNKPLTAPTSDSLHNQYEKTLLFAYLHKLCTERIAVHQSWKKTNLLCENSVKNMHSNTAKLLQQYAIHDYTDNDLNSFPGSLQRAAAFFSEQHNRYLRFLMDNYNALKNSGRAQQQQPPHVHCTNSFVDGVVPPHVVTHPSNHNVSNRNVHSKPSTHPVVNEADRVAPINYVAIKRSDIAVIMDRLAALERKHNDQANQISTLTAKCQLLQTAIDHDQVNDVRDAHSTSMIAAIPSSGGAVSHFDKLASSNDQYANDQTLRCGVAPSASSMHGPRSRGHGGHSQGGIIGIQSSPSMTTHSGGHNDSNSVNTRSTRSTHYSNNNQLALPQISGQSTASSSAPSSSSHSSTHAHQVPVPIPFYSLSAQHENEHNNNHHNMNRSQSAYLLHSQHQFDLSYQAPPPPLTALYNQTNTATTTTTSTPRSASIHQYGAGAVSHPLTAPPPLTAPHDQSPTRGNIGGFHPYEYGLPLQGSFAMFSNPNSNVNESKNDENNKALNDRDTEDERDAAMQYMTSSVPNTASNNVGLFNSNFLSSDSMMFDHHNSTPNATNNVFTFSQMEYN